MNRLETISMELANKLRNASSKQQHAAAILACNFAVSQSGINEPLVDEALVSLKKQTKIDPEKMTLLETLVLDLDAKYFNLQQAVEEGHATDEEYLKVFAKARAASAVLNVFNDDHFKASSEAIYEASATTDKPEELFSRIDLLIKKNG